MEYLTTSEAARKWDITRRRVNVLCNEGRIQGAIQKGKIWLIPESAVKPMDGRTTRYDKNNGNRNQIVLEEKGYVLWICS